jgi:tetratricopeptide (TPR) repeat protein
MKDSDKEFLDKKRPKQLYDIHLKDYELAVKHYQKIIDQDENSSDAYVNLGFIYLDSEDYDNAVKCFQKIVELEPDNTEAYNNLGYVHEKMDMFDSAKKCYEKALELNNNDIEATINIGHILELQGDYHTALSQYEKAIKIDSNSISARFCLAVLYDHHDMYDEALNEYTNIIQINPTHAKTLYNLGRIYFQFGNYNEALKYFKHVLELDPENADAWNNLGSVYETINNLTEALSAYNKSLAVNPFHEETNVNIANIQYLLYLSDPESAKIDDILRRLHFVLSLNPHNKKVQKLLERIQKPAIIQPIINRKDERDKETLIETKTLNKTLNSSENSSEKINIFRQEARMNISKLNKTIDTLKENLGEALLSTDIWGSTDMQSIAAFNHQPAACILFGQIINMTNKALNESGFPILGKYCLFDLVDSKMVVVIPMGDFMWGMLLDGNKIQLGLLLNVVMPKALAAFEEAITSN